VPGVPASCRPVSVLGAGVLADRDAVDGLAGLEELHLGLELPAIVLEGGVDGLGVEDLRARTGGGVGDQAAAGGGDQRLGVGDERNLHGLHGRAAGNVP